MFDIPVQRVLVAYVRQNVPITYGIHVEALRNHVRDELLGVRDPAERRVIGRAYFQAKAAMVIRLARIVSAAA